MKYVSIAKAAYLLGISRQRVQQLLYVRRIKGAFKEGRFWKIPLLNHEMPQVIPVNRGRKGTWRKFPQRATTYIHVNQNKIRSNRKKTEKEPVICVREGIKERYCDKVEILGGLCTVVYDPDHPKSCGATVWVEINPEILQKIELSNPLAAQCFG